MNKELEDALEALEMSNGTIEFEEWFPAFLDDCENASIEDIDRLEKIFNRAEEIYFNR